MSNSSSSTTTIQVTKATRDAIWELKQGPSDSYDRVLCRELGLNVEQAASQ